MVEESRMIYCYGRAWTRAQWYRLLPVLDELKAARLSAEKRAFWFRQWGQILCDAA
jgi:hypothetical protein